MLTLTFTCSQDKIVVIHGSPLHTNVATLSSLPSLDDLSQIFFAFTPIQLPLSSSTIHLTHASTCSLNPQLIKVPRSLEPSFACSPSFAFPGGLNSSSSSVINCLREMTKALWCRSEIQNINFDNIKIVQMPFLT